MNQEKLREAVFTSLGEASMCWVPPPGTGTTAVFDSTRCELVGERLIDEINGLAVDPMNSKERLHRMERLVGGDDWEALMEMFETDPLVHALMYIGMQQGEQRERERHEADRR